MTPPVKFSPGPAQLKAEAARFLRLLFAPGQVFEVRVLGLSGNSKRIDAGCFDDLDKAADSIITWDRLHKPKGIYVTLNPLQPAMLARAANRIKEWMGEAAKDKNVLVRRW